jgi:PadR family transcriptional regulator, regulatory protein PadR
MLSLPKLSTKEAQILALLTASSTPLFGLEMVEASQGSLKRGTIYVTLMRLKDKGLIDSKAEPRPSPEVGIARRLYWPTALGVRVFRAYSAAQTNFNTIPSEVLA